MPDDPASGVSQPPRLSVVVPTQLRSGLLTRCLTSLTSQDLSRSWELLVVQHGPDDGTRAAVAQAARERPQITIRHVAAGAVTRAEAKNEGIRESTGDHVVFVHDDDELSPTFLSGLLTDPQHGDCLIVPLRVPRPTRGPADLTTTAARRLLRHAGRVVAPKRLAASLTPVTGIAIPRALLSARGFDSDLVIGEDQVMLAHILRQPGLRCAIPPATSGAVYFHAAGRGTTTPILDPKRLFDGVTRLVDTDVPADLGVSIDRLVAGSVQEINRYLQSHPDAHAAVIAERRTRGLGTVIDLRRLNHRVARDLAVIYTAAPHVDTSANVAARRVLTRARIVDVVSNDMSSRLAVDPSSDQIWAEFVDRRIVVDARPADIWWPGVTEFCHKGMAEIIKAERSKGPYRSVYSRAMHPTSHFLAAWFKLRRPQVTWRAEFSDPMRFDVRGELRPSSGVPDPVLMADLQTGLSNAGFAPPDSDNLFSWLETITYALADEIMFTNQSQRGYMLDRCPDARLRQRVLEHSVVSHHPVPASWLYSIAPTDYPLPQDRINIGYFGVFYATRGLSEVWQALRRLPRSIRQVIALHVFTSKPDELAEELRAAGLDDVVTANSYVPYLQYLNLATQFDVLVVNDAHTVGIHDRNPYLPSKWADYTGSGSAVWGIVEPGSVLDTQNLDYRSELDDVDGALRILGMIVNERRESPRKAASHVVRT